MTTYSTAQCLRRVPRRPRGFGLVQVLLLIAVMAGLATLGYLQWRERTLVDSSRQERQALAQADQAIIAFATVMKRLPCPDINRDGEEDCTTLTDQKGWLPSVTLRLAGADPGVDVGQLRYLVQRGPNGNNLTQLTDSWRPLEYDEGGQTFDAMRGAAYPTDILTLTDLCQRLETARTTPAGAALARVNAATPRPVAYALAHPGSNDADGDGDLFDGANSNAAANANLMEDPARRPVLAVYNDLVLDRSFASVQAAFQCQPLIDSINTVALAHDVVAQVAGMQEDNIESARRAVAFSTLAAVMTGLEIVLTIAEGISDAGNAAIDWAACAASLGLAVNFCAAAPQHTVAIGLAGGVVIANGLAVVANAVAAGVAGTALTLADSGATPAQVCPPMNQTLLTQMLASAQTELTNATNARIAVQAAITAKTSELSLAEAAKTTAIATLRSVIRGTGASSGIDSRVDQLLTATDNWGTTSFARALADLRWQDATKLRDTWAAEVAKYNLIAANSAAAIASLNADIVALDAQIAATPPPVTDKEKEDLRILVGKRDGKRADIKMAESIPVMVILQNEIAALDAQIATNPPDVAQLQAQRAIKARALQSNLFASARAGADRDLSAAESALTTAADVLSTAQSSFDTAEISYQTAYARLASPLLIDGRYATRDSNGNVVDYRCITNCQPGDTNISIDLDAALSDLFGASRSTSPSTDAKYLRPVKLQKELDALEDQFAAAQTRETQAQDQFVRVQQMVDNPAACAATGSAVIPMKPSEAEAILIQVDRKGGTR